MKDFVERTQQNNLNELKNSIIESYDTITQEMIYNWISHVTACLNKCIENKGY